MEHIPIIIPSYEPDDRLVTLVEELQEYRVKIVIVNDGSDPKYDGVFQKLVDRKVTVLRHAVNQGKGRALKTAFNYCLLEDPNLIGCVTADSDGQHLPKDILHCCEELNLYPDNLILGCRDFDDVSVPSKSKYGNKITRNVFKYLCGLKITDTQTGLRGIPARFMKELLNIPGERFEFETNMLIASKEQYPLREVSIRTVYDSKENHTTHFDPIRDSIRIYRILGRIFLKFAVSSLSASVIDLSLFALFCVGLKSVVSYYIIVATILARVISASYNYIVNYKIVFKSNEQHVRSTVRYIFLAGIQGILSALLVNSTVMRLGVNFEVLVKIVVDTFLFVISFYIQREFVFKKKSL